MSGPARLLIAGRAVLAGLCLAASVPPWGWWPLAFVGIALLGPPASPTSRWGRRFRRTWLVAAAWLFPAMFWMWDLTAPGLRRGRRRSTPPTSRWPPRCARRAAARWVALPGAVRCWPRWPAGPSPSAGCPWATWP